MKAQSTKTSSGICADIPSAGPSPSVAHCPHRRAPARALSGRAGASAGTASRFPCQDSINSNENPSKGSLFRSRLFPYQQKQKLILHESIQALEQGHGIERLGFLTLTFKENLCDFDEAQRRFNSLRTGVLSKLFKAYICIVERQRRGAVHYHLLVVCRHDIRRGLNFEALRRRDYSSACPRLKELWRVLRTAAARYGFGRTELLPIRTHAAKMASYVSKYFSKAAHERDAATHRHHLIRYSKGARNGSTQFQWVNGRAKLWRHVLSLVLPALGVQSIEEATPKLGNRWAWRVLQCLEVLGVREVEGFGGLEWSFVVDWAGRGN